MTVTSPSVGEVSEAILTPRTEAGVDSPPPSPDISTLSIHDPPAPALDLNYGRAFTGSFVTFIIGPTAEVFHVHRGKFAHAPPKLQDLINPPCHRLSKDVRLRDEDPEMFGIFVEWLYGSILPAFNAWWDQTGPLVSAACRSLAAVGVPPLSLPSKYADNNAETFLRNDGLDGRSEARANHVGFFGDYQALSPEELRLLDTSWDVDLIQGYTAFLAEPIASYADKCDFYNKRRGANLFRLKDRLQARENLQKEGVLQKDEACQNIEREYFQWSLLKLVIFAAKHDWTALVDEAMTAYRDGERYLARKKLPLRHIELGYETLDTQSPAGSAILKFMVDYAFYLGKTRRKQSSWVSIGTKHSDFLADIMKREEGSTPVQGFNVSTGAWDQCPSLLEGGHFSVSASAKQSPAK